MSKKTFKTALLSAVCTLLILTVFLFPDMITLYRLKQLLLHNYVGDVSEKQLMEGAARGMVAALEDPHSVYFDEEEYKIFLDEMNASYLGIGVEVRFEDDKLQITKVFPDSPASDAGLFSGDIIIAADAIAADADNYTEAIKHIRSGDADSSLDLQIRRGEETLSVTVLRKEIQLDTVETKAYDDITYIRITGFDTPTAGEMAKAIEEAEKRSAKGLIIDVRDNPGGYLDSVTEIADMLLGEATVVYTKDKSGKQMSLYESDADCTTLPIVLLINENSASASEVLAGALKDNGRAELVGKNTYGKGSVQTIYTLRNGGVKVTVAHYYTAGDYIIDGNGIAPDYVVENTDDAVDLQLEKALELLQ